MRIKGSGWAAKYMLLIESNAFATSRRSRA